MIEFMIQTITLPVLVIGIISAILFWCCCRAESRKPPPLVTDGQAAGMRRFNITAGLISDVESTSQGNESVYCTSRGDIGE